MDKQEKSATIVAVCSASRIPDIDEALQLSGSSQEVLANNSTMPLSDRQPLDTASTILWLPLDSLNSEVAQQRF